MGLEELDVILNKEAIIPTYPLSYFKESPETIEHVYGTYALTHIPLGDTEKYVDTIFKWVGGGNKGAFIGAVVGNYGEGKTSFLIHVWSESLKKNIFTVPPFEWSSFSEIIDITYFWVDYILKKTHPHLAKKVFEIYKEFKEKDIKEFSKEIAKKTGKNVEDVSSIIEATGRKINFDTPALHFVDYCKKLTEIIKSANYKGLLILFDEPEVAAKAMDNDMDNGKEKVSHWLFNLANELHRQDGDYGIFFSMAENFLAYAQRRFIALPARLQIRDCFPRLKDIYGADFAKNLWERYVETFKLGNLTKNIVSDETLMAIGQVSSSERSDLSYGPRTVVSAFNRMIFHFQQTNKVYEPFDFIRDCLSNTVLIHHDYISKIRDVLSDPIVKQDNLEEIIKFLCAYPNGIPLELVKEKGYEDILLPLVRRRVLIYKTHNIIGVEKLRKSDSNKIDELREAINDINDEFAPSQETFSKVLEAFISYIIPIVFIPRQGKILGWQTLEEWKKEISGVFKVFLTGTFQQTEKQFPLRNIGVYVGSIGISMDKDAYYRYIADNSDYVQLDAIFHFQLRWNSRQPACKQRIEIELGNVVEEKCAIIKIYIDLLDGIVKNIYLDEIMEGMAFSPLWILHLLGRMKSFGLNKENEGLWNTTVKQLQTCLISLFFNDVLRHEVMGILNLSSGGSGIDLPGCILREILVKKYNNYSTLIKQPQWSKKIDEYIKALKNSEIPLACKRGIEDWNIDTEKAAKALGTNKMNFKDAYQGFDNLISISTPKSSPAIVKFKLHPFEQEISKLIIGETSDSKRKLKIEGKECWWIKRSRITSLRKTRGYTSEELEKIIEIGISRGTFAIDKLEGEEIFYCKPFDIEQMKLQLKSKLEDLKQETEVFRKYPDYKSSFNLQEEERKIENIKDEIEYERIFTGLEKEFEKNYQSLPRYFDQINGDFNRLRKKMVSVKDEVLKSREASLLNQILQHKSHWREILEKRIIPNLKLNYKECDEEANKILTNIDRNLTECTFNKAISPRDNIKRKDNIERLIKLYRNYKEVEGNIEDISSKFKQLSGQLKEYEEWIRVLRKSDELYDNLIKIKSGDLKQKAEEFFIVFDSISNEIIEHFEQYNINGLKNYNQFFSKIDELDQDRHNYITGLQGEFNNKKTAVIKLLDSLKINQYIKETYNPLSPEDCYKNMFREAANYIQTAISNLLIDINAYIREIKYNRDVLKKIQELEASLLLSKLETNSNDLLSFKKAVNTEWVQKVINGHSEQSKLLLEKLNNAHNINREAHSLTKFTNKDKPFLEERSKKFFDLIPERNPIDLKEVILSMMSENHHTEQLLDESLEYITDLFRKNYIQIRIDRL